MFTPRHVSLSISHNAQPFMVTSLHQSFDSLEESAPTEHCSYPSTSVLRSSQAHDFLCFGSPGKPGFGLHNIALPSRHHGCGAGLHDSAKLSPWSNRTTPSYLMEGHMDIATLVRSRSASRLVVVFWTEFTAQNHSQRSSNTLAFTYPSASLRSPTAHPCSHPRSQSDSARRCEHDPTRTGRSGAVKARQRSGRNIQ